MNFTSILFQSLIVLSLIGCVSTSKDHFVIGYGNMHGYVMFDPQKHLLIFSSEQGQVRPIIGVVDGKLIPGSFFQFKQQPFEVHNLGHAYFEPRKEKEFITLYSEDFFSIKTKERYPQEGIYSSRKIQKKGNTRGDATYLVAIGGDTDSSYEWELLYEWTTDINNNGRPETWLFQRGMLLQIWENFRKPQSALLYQR